MSFAERLKSLREQERYSQEDLSRLIDVRTNTIWRWENNKANPDIETVRKIAQVLKTTAAYLFGETDNPSLDVFHDTVQAKNEDVKTLSTGGAADNMFIIDDKNTGKIVYYPNNEEGRKLFLQHLALNLRLDDDAKISNSITGDNNSNNQMGLFNSR